MAQNPSTSRSTLLGTTKGQNRNDWHVTRNDLPLVPRSKEGLVEGFCAIKHKTHKCEVGHVPIVERLVEGVCVLKHPLHIRHFGHVPLVERLVEGFCSSKHPSHIRHVGHVPFVERLLESGRYISVTLDTSQLFISPYLSTMLFFPAPPAR